VSPPGAAAMVSWAEGMCCSCQRRADRLAARFGVSLRICLPMNCIWRRLPSKLVMRLASATASISLSGSSRLGHQVGAQRQQVFAELLQLGAFALEVGAAWARQCL